MDKKWYLSKTLWFNIVALAIAVLANYGYVGELPEDWQVFVTPIIALVNLILRLFTKEPIERTLT